MCTEEVPLVQSRHTVLQLQRSKYIETCIVNIPESLPIFFRTAPAYFLKPPQTNQFFWVFQSTKSPSIATLSSPEIQKIHFSTAEISHPYLVLRSIRYSLVSDNCIPHPHRENKQALSPRCPRVLSPSHSNAFIRHFVSAQASRNTSRKMSYCTLGSRFDNRR